VTLAVQPFAVVATLKLSVTWPHVVPLPPVMPVTDAVVLTGVVQVTATAALVRPIPEASATLRVNEHV
jgi:hypothetical protein